MDERKAAYITVKPTRAQLFIETPFNMRFIEQLKKRIPVKNREWDEAGRIWKVSGIYKNPVIEMVKACYPDIGCYLIEGNITTNLHTGETVHQEAIFGEG